jgi:virginiamycin B lyase
VKQIVILMASVMLACSAVPAAAQATDTFDLKEWDVEWGGRTRDPYVAPDGKVWFVGQAGNYIAYLDPTSGQQKRFDIEANTNPHTLIVDAQGTVWYAGNRNGRIGRLDPATGAIKTIMTGEAKDPHTMVFDGKGNIWFTSQGSNRVGRLNMTTEKVDLVVPNETPSNPYGIVMHNGAPYIALLRTNTIAKVDPNTLAVTKFTYANEASRSRRLDVLPDGTAWYGDEARGYIGRINLATGEAKEWAAPGGAQSRPYALTRDDQGRIWFTETGDAKRLVGFDPKTERFFANIEVSGTIRHMYFDNKTRMMWFGTDANKVGRIALQKAR